MPLYSYLSQVFPPPFDHTDRMTIWTREEDKTFENGLAVYGNIDQWEKIAAMIPGKSIDDVKEHYRLLVDDIISIEAGDVPLPDYDSSSEILADDSPEDIGLEKRSAKSTADRRKAVPWTEEEHGLFLQGLDRLGRGDWRGIARQYVLTRTSAQVASHAQKYFKRMEPGRKKKRLTIHDAPVDKGSKSGGQRRVLEGESSQFPIKIGDLGEIPVQTTDISIPAPWMTGIGMQDKQTNYFGIDSLDSISNPQGHYLPIGPMTDIFQFDSLGNIPVSQGPILYEDMTDINMGDDATDFFQFDPLGSISSLQGAIGIGIDTTPTMHQSSSSAQTYGFAGIDFGTGMPVGQMSFDAQLTSLAPIDTVDDSGSVIPPTDVGSSGFSST